MSERWRDFKGQPDFVFHPWMRTVDDLEDQIAEMLETMKQARPYVKGSFDQTAFTNFQHIPARVLARIDAAIAKSEDQS